MKYWQYRAYDAKMETHEGIVTGHTLEDVALKLRQHGLQLLYLTSTTARNYNTHLKNHKQIKSLKAQLLYNRFQEPTILGEEQTTPPTHPSQSHANLSQYLLIFVVLLLMGLVCYQYMRCSGN